MRYPKNSNSTSSLTPFVIIRGPAGVGKSRVAKKLTKLLGGYYISFDKILCDNNLDYIPGEKCVPQNKFLIANKIVIPIAQKMLSNGKTVIFDGNFYHKSQIENLITKLDNTHFVFTLKANLNKCLTRNKTRNFQLNEQSVKDVFKLVSKFDYGTVIDTNNKTVKEIIDIIFHKLNITNTLNPK